MDLNMARLSWISKVGPVSSYKPIKTEISVAAIRCSGKGLRNHVVEGEARKPGNMERTLVYYC